MAAVSRARKAAFTILVAVEHGHAHSDDLLRAKDVSALSPVDRNLATALVLGVLRWQIQLDHQLQGFLKRPGARLDLEVRIALRLGAFQILHLDRIPARAAIDESVELTKQAGHKFASGMVNAVLRKLAIGRSEGSGKTEDLKQDVALAYAHPAWMVERWTDAFGAEAACAICSHDQAQPFVAIRLASPDADAELIETGIAVEPGELLAASRTIAAGDVTSTEAWREGRVRVQDEGSQLVGEIAAFAGSEIDVNRILDVCAAPGGKTLILAERHLQARIVACESSPQRLEQLRQRLAPLGERIECRLADATALTDDSEFDLVLADVPCSGTGTLGRNPEIRHRLQVEELARQAQRQKAILTAALRAVRPGGRVIYSTCSLEAEENEQVIAAVLQERGEARIVGLASGIEAMREQGFLSGSGAERLESAISADGFLRLLPGSFHSDGFFVCLLERGMGAS